MASRGKKDRVLSIALVIGSTLFSLLFLEVATRIADDVSVFLFKNFAAEKIYKNWDRKQEYKRLVYHPKIGWTLPPSPNGNPHGFLFHKTDPAFPDIAPLAHEPGRSILVLGDSMATWPGPSKNWPHQLELITGIPVVNAGVGGYGLDQIYLRLVEVLPDVDPSLIVVSFIPDDVRRTELSVFHGSPKPYFTVDGGKLKLMNTPVPDYQPSA